MPKKRPNILFIMGDQHRVDCLGIYGNKEIKTPYLDCLGNDGVVYNNSFCTATSCAPSRYSIITGMYPYQHLGYENDSNIPAGIDTFPRILHESGYKTKAVGKMHLTPTYLDVGFDEMILAEQTPPGRFEDDYHLYLKENKLINELDLVDQVDEYREYGSKEYWESFGAMKSNLPEEYDSTHWIGEKALESLDQWREEDENFLMVSFIKPHHPFDPPTPWDHLYDPDKLSLLPGWTDQCLEQDLSKNRGFFPHEHLSKEKLRQVMAYYYANISHIDFQIGKLMELLKQKEMYDNTLIIYTSDHGEYMGFHHMLLKGNHLYDPLTRVPLVIKYPNQLNKGTHDDHLVSSIDLAPTILGFAECKVGQFMPGKNIFNMTDASNEFIYSQSGRGNQYMIRSKRYKLLWTLDNESKMFFDLMTDPLEFSNLYNDATYKKEIELHKEALINLILFHAPSPVHLDSMARTMKKRDKGEIMRWNKEKISTSKLIN